jgi:hypothetical protein
MRRSSSRPKQRIAPWKPLQLKHANENHVKDALARLMKVQDNCQAVMNRIGALGTFF